MSLPVFAGGAPLLTKELHISPREMRGSKHKRDGWREQKSRRERRFQKAAHKRRSNAKNDIRGDEDPIPVVSSTSTRTSDRSMTA